MSITLFTSAKKERMTNDSNDKKSECLNVNANGRNVYRNRWQVILLRFLRKVQNKLSE